jgi:hypothetical protein
MRAYASIVLAGLLAVGPTARAGELDLLVNGLAAGGEARSGSVAPLAWVERTGDGFELVVTLEPRDGAKLVADPGITVQALSDPRVVWGEMEATAVDPTRDYFLTRPVLRLPFRGSAESVGARIDFAWCVVSALCRFGEAEVTARVPHEG